MAVISNTIIDLLDLRIKNEEQSARLYKSMSLWLNLNGYMGAAKLWCRYSEEESVHVKWAIDYLLSLNVLPTIPEQPKPLKTFKGLPSIVALSYQHELQITEECKELAKQALKEGDAMTLSLAQKYLAEQVEELDKMQAWLDKLEAFGDSKESLFLLDQEMGR